MRMEEDIKKELKEQYKAKRLKELNTRINSSSGGMTYSFAVISYYAASLFMLMFLVMIKVDGNEEVITYANYLSAPVAILACLIFTMWFRNFNCKAIFHVKCKFRYFIIAILFIFGLLFSLSWLNDVSLKFFKLLGYKERDGYFPNLSGGYVIPALFVMAVLPAVFEELLFRGLMLSCCEKNMGSVGIIFTIGLCFALFHGSPEQTVYQFIAGCAFTFLAIRSGSILPSILMHFLNNAVIVLLQAFGAFDASGALRISAGGNIALIVVAAACLVGAVVWLILDGNPLKKREKGATWNFYKFAAYGIIAMTVVWITTLCGLG